MSPRKKGNPFEASAKKTQEESKIADAFARGEALSKPSAIPAITETDGKPKPAEISTKTLLPKPRPKSKLKQENNAEDPLVPFNMKITTSRRRKLKQFAANHDTTITQLINAWIDTIPEE